MTESTWTEMDGAAWRAEVRDENGYTRRTADARLTPGRDVEVTETDDGLLVRGLQDPDGRHSDTDGLLERFTRLADGEDAAVAAYVERFGFLELCEAHGLPWRHDPSCERERRRSGPLIRCAEPVAVWRERSRQYRAALAAAANLHQGRQPREGDWLQLWPPDRGMPFDVLAGTLRFDSREAERAVLARYVDRELRLAGSRPVFTWPKGRGRPLVRIGSEGLSQVLARELALAVARLDGMAVCDGCARPYAPRRKPRPDVRNFCRACREAGVPARLRKRDQRTRERGEDS